MADAPAPPADHLAAAVPAIDERKRDALAVMARAGTEGVNAFLRQEEQARQLAGGEVFQQALGASRANYQADFARMQAALEKYASEAGMAEGALRAQAQAQVAGRGGGGGGGGGGRRGGGGGGGGGIPPSGEVLARREMEQRAAARTKREEQARRAAAPAREKARGAATSARQEADARRAWARRYGDFQAQQAAAAGKARGPSRAEARVAARDDATERQRMAQRVIENRRRRPALPTASRVVREGGDMQAAAVAGDPRSARRIVAGSRRGAEDAPLQALRQAAADRIRLDNEIATQEPREREIELLRRRNERTMRDATWDRYGDQWVSEQAMDAYNARYAPEVQEFDREEAARDELLFSRSSPEAIQMEVETVADAEFRRLLALGESENDAWQEVYGHNGYMEDYYNTLRDTISGPTSVYDDVVEYQNAQLAADLTPALAELTGLQERAAANVARQMVESGYGDNWAAFEQDHSIDPNTGIATPLEDPLQGLRDRAVLRQAEAGMRAGITEPTVSLAIAEMPEYQTILQTLNQANLTQGEAGVMQTLRDIEQSMMSDDPFYSAFAVDLGDLGVLPSQVIRMAEEDLFGSSGLALQYDTVNPLG